MGRYLAVPVVVLLASFFLFPVAFTFLPSVNTKMVLAGTGLVWAGFDKTRKGQAAIGMDFFVISAWALAVSFMAFAAIVCNGTSDFTYVSYLVSMWVWLGGAYTIVSLIKLVHGNWSIRLIGNYVIGVCIYQCISALLADFNEGVRQLAQNALYGFDYYQDRMLGFGAALDPAGIRFSAALVVIAYLYGNIPEKEKAGYKMTFYLAAFFFISVIGNMIARTTSIGMILGLIYWIYLSVQKKENAIQIGQWLGGTMVFLLPIVLYFYYVNPHFKSNIEFAFEGFFSLVRKGRWEVHSNEILKSMIVFPDSFKTWLIGDGYMENPYDNEMYYIGPKWSGFYKDTDIGYLRFIFYFGLPGLAVFCAFFIYAAKYCIRKMDRHKELFFMLVLLNFVAWCKVTTDLFCVFALFLACDVVNEKKQLA